MKEALEAFFYSFNFLFKLATSLASVFNILKVITVVAKSPTVKI